MQKVKHDDLLEVEFKRLRNPQFHRKFFALLQLVLDNQDKYSNMQDLLTEIKLQVGHYDEYVTLGGKLIYLPKSIAFGAMDDLEFGVFYNKVVDVILKYFLRGMKREELDALVDQIIGFT